MAAIVTTPSHIVLRLIRAGVITGVSDALFSSVLAAFFYGSTVGRLWRGVASVPLGAATSHSSRC